MHINYKNISLFTIIFIGYTFFLTNILNLNFEKQKDLNSNNVDEKQIQQLKPKISKTLKKEKNDLNIIINESQTIEKYIKKVVKVNKGETFSEILNDFNLGNINKFKLIELINEYFNLRSLKVNQNIIFLNNQKNKLKQIIIELDYKTNLIVNLDSKITIEKKELNTITTIESKEYLIANSLYADGIKNNLPNEILIKLIQLFSFDLDFQRDIRKDTKVSISYEKTSVENKFVNSYGDIEYARISIKNNTLEYFKFLTDEGFKDYFNRDGKNVKKSILKTPLDGAKISSNFGMRKHPISGFNKMHKGVDFAAPIGTPIYAGGNGVIEFVGYNGGYGKYIRIRHNNGYKTAYAHLNSYRKGISKGIRVNQGDIIGYVGNTGRSTGPHLHYEIIYQNEQINPMTLKLPSGKILEGQELIRFQKKYKTILANHLNNLYE
tara:strand:+ start:1205 stop:2512 length:1308 start_codon:yes stop_codon:yes gene_type:complete